MLSQWEIILSALMGLGSTSCCCVVAKPQLPPNRDSSEKKCFLLFLNEAISVVLVGCFYHTLISKSQLVYI